MKGMKFQHRSFLLSGLWAVLSLGLVEFVLPGMPASVQAQVEKVEELHFPPLPDLVIPEPQRVVLDNGLVVLLMEDHELPLVGVSAFIRTGSRLEPQGKIGLASLTGTVLRTGGTKNRTGDELDEYLEGKAAGIETAIGDTSGTASMSCLAEDFPEVLKVFGDVLRFPVFDPEKLKIAKNQVMAEISRQNDDPDGILSREFKKLIYGKESPYTWDPTYATVSSITREDVMRWHATYFHPNRIILGVSGDFQKEKVLALIKTIFGDWAKGPEVMDPTAFIQPAVPAGVFYVEKDDMTQAKIAMGHMGIRRDDPDYYSLVIVNQILSGSFGARLFSNIRSKQGLAYDVHGGVGLQWDYPGMAILSMSTKTETTGKGIDALITEARNMVADPPSDDEVAKAKTSILNSFVFSVDSPAKVLGKYLTYEYYGYSSTWLKEFRQGIEKVTTTEVRMAAQKHLRPSEFAILVVGPRTGTKPALARYDRIQELDIRIPEPPAGM
ncbi:MAG: insulinase family protein [Nitrospirota bacterium]|nr:insulinase family protein [Nitrospirota bacterium]MDH4360923.1 insulinase family protein [Nitrospirota bacterium]MDH5575648.1 insulinase family protein [Nitrospirota bacterium]